MSSHFQRLSTSMQKPMDMQTPPSPTMTPALKQTCTYHKVIIIHLIKLHCQEPLVFSKQCKPPVLDAILPQTPNTACSILSLDRNKPSRKGSNPKAIFSHIMSYWHEDMSISLRGFCLLAVGNLPWSSLSEKRCQMVYIILGRAQMLLKMPLHRRRCNRASET